MSEREPFVKVQVTFEVNLYYGRLAKPYDKEGNWLVYFRDQFTTTWVDNDNLRPGEYIVIKDARVLPSEQFDGVSGQQVRALLPRHFRTLVKRGVPKKYNMVNTFLPRPDYAQSAQDLDYKR